MSLSDLLNEQSLKDRVVIITGGGRGLGWSMAYALLEAGSRVMVTAARAKEELAQVEEVAREAFGPDRLVTSLADVTNEADCRRVFNETMSAFGGCHGLINNAARGPAEARSDFPTNPPKLWEVDAEARKTIIDTNVNGPFLMTKTVIEHFMAQGFGRIINISTSLPNMTRAGNAGYGPSKAALEVESVQWANDLAGTGVTVNVLLPGGPTDTALIPGGDIGKRDAEWLLRPEVMNAPTLWLCSDLSNGVTGQRYIGKDWDVGLSVTEAEALSRQETHASPVII